MAKQLPDTVRPHHEAFARPIHNQKVSDRIYCFTDPNGNSFRISDKKNDDAFIESDSSVDTAEWI